MIILVVTGILGRGTTQVIYDANFYKLYFLRWVQLALLSGYADVDWGTSGLKSKAYKRVGKKMSWNSWQFFFLFEFVGKFYQEDILV